MKIMILPVNGCGISSCSFILVQYFCHVALALKGIDYEYKAVHLVKDGGEQVNNICI